MSQDPELRAHKDWLGYLQPVGLVVSPAALRDAQAFVNKNIVREQSILIRHVRGESTAATQRGEEPNPRLKDFPAFAFDFWGWESSDLAGGPGGPELPTSLEVPLADYGEVLTPRYAVPDPANAGSWLMLIDVRTDGANLDDAPKEDTNDKRWHASPQARFERLLRANQVPIGLLVNPEVIRIVYAPRGESTGHLTFPVKAMCEVAGRPIVAALHLLLDTDRLFTAATNQRLPWILQQSRKYQSEVSTKLAEQILRALNELMRGFQSANEATGGNLLADVLREAPQDVYGGLLTSLLRMVFILYAEDRGLLSNDPVYLNSYSLSGLFERLREDDAQYPDTMDQRPGAWAQFLTLCRLIYDGGGHGAMHLPPRHGRLFDPDAYSFLEGRPVKSKRASDEAVTPPRVSDGVIFRVLRDLLMLDGERLSYRSLDVEQIGSVYEAMMGFEVRTAPGTSIGLRPDHVVINLSALLGESPADRVKVLKEDAGCELTGKALDQLKTAENIEELVAAFGRRVSPLYLDERGMPLLVALGGIYLQPTEERRRSGSHYTPRSLTEPIVRTTLEPILKQLGEKPRPEQILDLKICDPAMGSGAFLVETCRFLAETLVESWSVHGQTPFIPPDQEPVLHARRLIAQRCLYGVDKNQFAVDLAKLSLWLATLAREHPFTFLDHSLRCGDSLVGLTRQQIAAFNWFPAGQQTFLEGQLRKRIDQATQYRQRILDARDNVSYTQLGQELSNSDEALNLPRMVGDAVIAAFFAADKLKQREEARQRMQVLVEADLKERGFISIDGEVDLQIRKLRDGNKAVEPFHWELEFPEVFGAESSKDRTVGFDAVIGNPPFLAGASIWPTFGGSYRDFLRAIHTGTEGKAVDLVAYFIRRTFELSKFGGTVGLIATNTVAQGDTRTAGLRYLCTHGGYIYNVRKRMPWPGQAAVIVSVVHFSKGVPHQCILDGKIVPGINSFLLGTAIEADPKAISQNRNKAFRGHVVYGMGFTFDDTDASGISSPLSLMNDLITENPRNGERIFPYIGGAELNTSPTQDHHRFIINFAELSQAEAEQWPSLLAIVREKILPERAKLGGYSVAAKRSERWWQYGSYAAALQAALNGMPRCLALSLVSTNHAVAFQPPTRIFGHSLVIFPLSTFAAFASLQAQAHEAWARFLGSSMKDDLRYTTSDCFDTFPFPENWETHTALEAVGKTYNDFRAAVMVKNDEGLTKTYNRFHDPNEQNSEIAKLRELHASMDRAVLDAYGWTDIPATYEFLLDYEIQEGEWGNKKKPWRYRWTDEVRDEVLGRLLELNRQRAEEESLAGAAADSAKPKKRGQKKSVKVSLPAPTLFSVEDPSK